MDIAALKADYDDRLAFWGGVTTQTVLSFGAPDEVRAKARGVRELMDAGEGISSRRRRASGSTCLPRACWPCWSGPRNAVGAFRR